MAISKEELAQIIQGKAAQLCSVEAERDMNRIAEQKRNDGNFINFDDSGDDFIDPYLNEESYQASNRSKQMNSSDMVISQKRLAESKLPDAIKQMMVNNPIDVSGMNPNKSVLSDMNIVAPKREPIREVYTSQSNINASQGIDYSLLKLIIEECIDRKLKEYMGKHSLNENTLKTIGLAEGKIKLVDNKGNVYMSNLQYQGNLKDKKK